MRGHWVGLLVAVSAMASGQAAVSTQLVVWQMQESGTTAGLRGIDSVDGTVAWASGTGGTVLRTVDGGAHWTKCAVPDGAKDGSTLDFRGVQARDAMTAIVMASGVGEKSRLYKTVDGCGSWRLLFKNPDKDGFWDAIAAEKRAQRTDEEGLMILGDPVAGKFVIWWSDDGTGNWKKLPTAPSAVGEGAFAASNSALVDLSWDGVSYFGSGGPHGARIFMECDPCTSKEFEKEGYFVQPMNMFRKGASAGIFSIAADNPQDGLHLVAVGGDYRSPNTKGDAAYTLDRLHWTAASNPPHGFRSAVTYDASSKAWITAGTNGSDISRDDGRTWKALDDGNWNALSLPFIVGPGGRIGRLNEGALGKP